MSKAIDELDPAAILPWDHLHIATYSIFLNKQIFRWPHSAPKRTEIEIKMPGYDTHIFLIGYTPRITKMLK